MVDAYFTFFWTNGPLVFLALVAIGITERRGYDSSLIYLVVANFCVSGPLLLLQLGSQSPISKALVGLISGERPRAVGWFFVFWGLVLGLGLLIPFAPHRNLHLAPTERNQAPSARAKQTRNPSATRRARQTGNRRLVDKSFQPLTENREERR
jgi:hypothetical protein